MQKLKLVAGLLGFSAVALGAFGAHALKPNLEASGGVETWHTAVLYHLIHAVAVLAIALAGRGLERVGWAWSAGVLLFSGSLYWLALGGPKWLGPVTPLGGLFFLLGWYLLARSQSTESAD